MESRPLDYIYDPTNVVGCRTDHVKALMKAQTYTAQIEPVFPNMFSKLMHYPSVQLRYRPANAVNIEQQMNAISNSSAQQPIESGIATAVQGQNRFKYHRRALIPFISGLNGQVYYDTANQISNKIAIAQKKINEPATKTIGIQTIYRESHAQTDPYTPDYLLPPRTPGGTQLYPEVLTLASLTYMNGLPVSVEEIERIERAREKRRWKETLPTGTDAESFEKRLKMMEKMELQEWAEREAEISRIHKTRLDILVRLIESRKQENAKVNQSRLENEWTRKLQERDLLMTKLQKKKDRELRRLDLKRKNFDSKPKKTDPIEKYAHNAFQKKTEMLRKQEISSQVPVYETAQALESIENAYKSEIEKVNVQLNLGENKWKEPKLRQEQQYQKTLDYIWNHVINHEQKKQNDQPLKFKTKVVKQEIRASTPQLQLPSVDKMFHSRLALFVQRIMRGRATELEMKKGLLKHKDLVEELRTRHTHEQDQQQKSVKESDFKVVIGPQDSLDKGIETVSAAYLGKMFDYYTKELVRLREERRLSAMVLKAERARKEKESLEREKRMQETTVRQVEEKAYFDALAITNMTVDSYLEGILSDSIETTGDIIAKEKIQEYAEKLKMHTSSTYDTFIEKPLMYSDDTKIVSDLVLSFLIPEVWRQSLIQDCEREQQKYLQAARVCIHNVSLDSEKKEQNHQEVQVDTLSEIQGHSQGKTIGDEAHEITGALASLSVSSLTETSEQPPREKNPKTSASRDFELGQ